MNRLRMVILGLLVLLTTAACSHQLLLLPYLIFSGSWTPIETPEPVVVVVATQQPQNLNSLVDALRTSGASVEEAGSLMQPFLSVTGQVIRVNGADLQVYEYPSEQAAASDAAMIAPDGSSTTTTMITWIEPPHFHRSGRLLVLYLGSDTAMLDLLTNLLGTQFAGR